MNKSEVVITMKSTTKGNPIEEIITTDPHRKSKAIKLFIGSCLEHGHLSPEDLFKYLKETKKLNFVHLVKYAFERSD